MNLKFYFDFLSPFSFFAWLNLRKTFPDSTIELHPIPMGKLFSHHKFPGPGEIPAKRDYELKKCFRYAHRAGIELNPPTIFPFNPLAVLRAATKSAAGEHQENVVSTLFSAIWEKSMVLDDPELIAELLNPISKDICELSFSKDARAELKANIRSAIEDGAFGVPSMVYKNELFWGNDEIDTLVQVVSGNDNWNRELYNTLREK